MDTALTIFFLGLLIFSAHLFNALFRFTKIPNVLILLVIGIIIGPVLGLVRPAHFGAVGSILSTATLILLLFESGINLKIGELFKSIGSAFMVTLFNFIASAVIATSVVMLTGELDLMGAAFFGIIVAGTSSAVVIPVIQQIKLNKKGSTTLLLESALSDVLCLVIGLALLEAMKQGVFDIGSIWEKVWKSFLLAALMGLAGGVIWSALLNRIRSIKNSIFTNLAFVFIIYGLTEKLGFNGGIATLIFGITLGNAHLMGRNFLLRPIFGESELRENEKSFFAELVFILATYFFVYVGICMQFSSVMIYLLALVIVLAIIFVRPLSIKLFVRSKMSLKDLSIMSVMAPKGLVPAILASIPLQIGIAGGQVIQDLSYSVILLSILICSILVIILSNDPFAISYLQKMLFGKSIEHDEQQIQESQGQLEEGTEHDPEGEGLSESETGDQV